MAAAPPPKDRIYDIKNLGDALEALVREGNIDLGEVTWLFDAVKDRRYEAAEKLLELGALRNPSEKEEDQLLLSQNFAEVMRFAPGSTIQMFVEHLRDRIDPKCALEAILERRYDDNQRWFGYLYQNELRPEDLAVTTELMSKAYKAKLSHVFELLCSHREMLAVSLQDKKSKRLPKLQQACDQVADQCGNPDFLSFDERFPEKLAAYEKMDTASRRSARQRLTNSIRKGFGLGKKSGK